MRTKTAKLGISNNRLKYDRREEIQCWLMLSIPIIGFFVFTLYPILWAIRISFFSYTGVKVDTVFVGLRNYIKLFTTDITYWKTWITTIEFAVLKLVLEYPLAFTMAVLLMGGRKGANFFRSIYFLPTIISTAIVGLIFSNLFDVFGPINFFLKNLGITSEFTQWFATKPTSLVALTITSLWGSVGTTMMYLMSALATVPKDVYESADIDGAGPFTKVFKITIPIIAPQIQIFLMMSLLSMLGANELILTLSNGAPAGSTHTVMSYLTSRIVPGFGNVGNLGYMSATSIITSILLACCSLIYNMITNKMKSR